MADLPFFQFYPADYLRDTEVLSLSAQGGWTRMLCNMWHPSRRGVLRLRLQAMSRLLHASEEATKRIIEEIEDCGVADVSWEDDRVAVTCRRMVRDWWKAEAKHKALSEGGRRGGKAKRKPRDAEAALKPPLKPSLSHPSSLAKAVPEARSQKPDNSTPKSPPAGGGVGVVDAQAEVEEAAEAEHRGDDIEVMKRRIVECGVCRADHRWTNAEEKALFTALRELQRTSELEWGNLRDWYALKEKAGETLFRFGLLGFLTDFPKPVNAAGQFFDRYPKRRPGAKKARNVAPIDEGEILTDEEMKEQAAQARELRKRLQEQR